MPLYEYRCDRCNEVFEVIQKFVDAPLTEHPTCGGPVERLLSAPAFSFKGSGFYITDYAKAGSSSGGNGKNGSPSSSGDSKAESSTPAPAATSSTATSSSSTETKK